MIEGVDYDDARPGGKALAAAGKRFACRYLAYRGNPDPRKPLTLGEISDLHGNGIAIVANFESTSNRMLDGAAAGAADANDARADMLGLGFPVSCPVYFSADFDPQPQYLARIDAYLTAAALVLGKARVGIYGGVDALTHTRQSGTAAWFWMAAGWDHGRQPPSFVHLWQYQTAGQGAPPINSQILLGWGQGGNTGITIRGFVLKGGNPSGGTSTAYHAGQESSEGVAIYRANSHVTIDHDTITDEWGHAVYVASGGHVGERTSFLAITNDTIARTGVMGIALATATDVVIDHDTITDTALYPIDFEDGTSGELLERIAISNVTITRWSWSKAYSPHAIVGDGSTGVIWQDITIDSVTLQGGPQSIASASTDGAISFWGSDAKTRLSVTRSTGFLTPGWAMRFNNVSGLLVTGNTWPIPAGGVLVHCQGCPGAVTGPNP